MGTLINLHELGQKLQGEFESVFLPNDVKLPESFKNSVKELGEYKFDYKNYLVHIYSSDLNGYIPNQWFIIASFFVDYYIELQKYKSLLIDILKSCGLSSADERKALMAMYSTEMGKKPKDRAYDEYKQEIIAKVKEKITSVLNNATALNNEDRDLLIQFVCNYDWWYGGKTIDRGDFYVSPILALAKVVNASHSYIAEICKSFAESKSISDKLREGYKQSHLKSLEDADNNNGKVCIQQIFYGAPGTGKSNTIKRKTKLAEEEGRVFRTTFHPDSDYSTFVGCYKPTTKNSSNQSILDYDSLVDRFKKYISDLGNITHASAAIGYNYHDSIVKMQEGGGHSIADLLADAHKSGTTYDTTIRSGMLLYEEQVQLGRVNSKITYEFVAQAFTNAYVKAWNTTDDVYLIIEEINRGNCAQIFGDLFQLLDRKNGESEYPVDADTDLANYLHIQLANTCRTDIPNEVKNGKKLKLPSNLYIWATMNTSDQSLFPIDSAFKRRWDWKYLKIKEGKDKNGNKLDWVIDVNLKDENGEERPVKWWAFIKKINEIIASMTSSADKQLGYFFCKADKKQNETDQYATIISEDAFVGKVLFYLWNDVFKDYGFEDATLFRFKSKEEDEEKESDKDLTFPDFYDEEGEKVNTVRVTDFVQKVMNWKKNNEENS